MAWLAIIWLIFAAIFLALGCYHWKMAGKSISHFQVSRNQLSQSGIKAQIHLVGIDFVEFVNKFNGYIDYYNQTSSKGHKTQAIGYWVASVIAIFSFVLVMVS